MDHGDGDGDGEEEEWKAAKLFLAKGPSATLQFARDDVKAMLYALDAQAMDGPAPDQQEDQQQMSTTPIDPAMSRRQAAWRSLGDMSKSEAKKRFLLLLSSLLPHWKAWKPPQASSSSSSDGLVARILSDFSAKTGLTFRSTL